MPDAKITSTVGIQMSPEGMTAAGKTIQQNIDNIISKLDTVSKKAEEALTKSGKVSNTVSQQINGQLKALGIQLKNLQTLQRALTTSRGGGLGAAGALGDFGNLQSLGRQARALGEMRSIYTQTGSAIDALRGRVIALREEQGRLLQRGIIPNNNSLLTARKIEDTAKAYGKITNEIVALRGRIAGLSSDGQRAFVPMLKSLDEMDKKNAKLFSNQNLQNFGAEVSNTRALLNNIRERLRVVEQIEAKTRLNVEALREEGRQILANTQYERQALLARQVAAGTRGIGDLRGLSGQPLSQRDVDLTSRFSRATALAATSRNQLNAALNAPNTSAERINTLINRHQALQKEIGNTIAQQMKLNDSDQKGGLGGFFGGFKNQIGTLYGGAGGSGGMAGAGALAARVAGYAVAASAIYGLISSMRDGLTFVIQFEDALAQLQAISGSTALEMERLSDSILKVSKESSNSVLELTKSATIIAQAGFSGTEIEQMLQSVTALADASGSSTDEAVDILTSTLGAFQLEAGESARVTDALVAALNDSKLSVDQVRLGLQYAGATARDNNISFNELVATLGAMADAGIRSGSTMSTGLRQMLIDFIDPSEKLIDNLTRVGLTTADIDVKTLGLVEVLRRLHDSGFQAYGALETRAAAAYQVLSTNIDGINKLEEATLRQGAAEEAQDQRLDSLSAKWTIFLNTLAETASLIGGILTPVFKGLVTFMTALVGSVNALIKPFGELLEYILTLGGSLGTTAVEAESFNQQLLDMGVSAGDAARLTAELGDSMADAETLAKDAEAGLETLETRQKTLGEETQKLMVRSDDLAKSKAEVAHQVDVLSSRFPGLRAEFAKTEGGINGLISAMIALENQARRTLTAQAQAVAVAQDARIRAANQTATQTQANSNRFRQGQFIGVASQRERQDVQRFNQLVQNRNWTEALDLASSVGANHPLRANPSLNQIVQDIGQFRYEYLDAQATRETMNNRVAQNRFLDTAEGQRLSNEVRGNTASATRASSQGTAGGRNVDQIKAGINESIRYLDLLEQKYKDNSTILGVIGQARSSQNAALAQLTPLPDKEKSGRSGTSAAERLARQRERDFARNEADIKKEEVEYRQQLYENSVKALEEAPDLSEIPDLMDDIDNQLRDWLSAESELALLEIKRNNPTPEQETRLLEAAGRKAEQLRVEAIDKIADTLEKAIKEYITQTTDAIERQFTESLRFTQRNVGIAQGRLKGISNPLYSNNIPDYMNPVLQRNLDVAEDRNNIATIGANDTKIAAYTQLISKVREEQAGLNRELEALGRIATNQGTAEDAIVVTGRTSEEVTNRFHDLDQVLLELETKTSDLIDTNLALKASYDVLRDVPKTFAQGLQLAVQGVQLEIGAADSLGQDLIKGLGGPLRALHEGFGTFFKDMLSGTATVGQAFKAFADSVIASIADMVAAALANQLFSLLANVAGSALGGPTSLLGGTPYGWSGGRIGDLPVKRMWGGGSVGGGMPTRDSTMVMAANDEYLIRRPAAMSIGKDVLDAMNQHGAKALAGMGSPIIPVVNNQGAPVNVYVIAPEERPQLGPNDVIATISNDVLKGGVTKKLIKQVAAGG